MNYFPKGNFMNSIYSAVNRVQGRGPRGCGHHITLDRRFTDLRPGFYYVKGYATI
jgi:hypothetical protein